MPNSWQDFDPTRYVPRTNAEQEMDRWANARSVNRRVLSFVAPLGSGKSWLVRRAQERWSGVGNRFVELLEVPVLLKPPPAGTTFIDRHPNEMFDPKHLSKWIERAHHRARALCDSIPDPEIIDWKNYSPSHICSEFAEALCTLCARLEAPILIVDAYDELKSEEEASFFSNQILEPLIRSDCVRMLIPRRDDIKLQGIRLRFEEELVTWSPQDTILIDDQYRLYLTPFPFTLEDLKNVLPDYKWNHPFINDFLLNRALENYNHGRALLNIPNDLKNCITALIVRYADDEMGGAGVQAGRNRFPPLPDLTSKVLFQLLELPEQWTDLDLRKQIKRNLSDPHIKELFAYSLIVRGDIFYHIADGVREILMILSDHGAVL